MARWSTPSCLQLGQQFMNLHRIGRGVRQAASSPFGPDHAHRSQAGGGLAQRRPDFAQESDDGGFALGAGDGGDDVGLAGEESGGIARQAGAGIFVGNEAHAQRRDLVGDGGRAQHRDRAARHRILHESRAVGLGPGQSGEQIARLHFAAVAGQAGKALHAHHGAFLVLCPIIESDCGVIRASSASLVGGATLGTPSSGAMRWITRPTAGAAVQPASAKPAVSLVPCG